MSTSGPTEKLKTLMILLESSNNLGNGCPALPREITLEILKNFSLKELFHENREYILSETPKNLPWEQWIDIYFPYLKERQGVSFDADFQTLFCNEYRRKKYEFKKIAYRKKTWLTQEQWESALEGNLGYINNLKDNKIKRILMGLCAARGDSTALKSLAKSDRKMVLYMATRNGSVQMVARLLELFNYTSDNIINAAKIALEENHTEVIRFFLHHCFEQIEIGLAFECACKISDLNAIEKIIVNHFNELTGRTLQNAFKAAGASGKFSLISTMLRHFKSPNYNYIGLALEEAVFNDKDDTAKCLLATYGKYIHKRYKNSALKSVIHSQKVLIIDLLVLSNGIKYQLFALKQAVEMRALHVVKHMLDNYQDINTSKVKVKAMHWAAEADSVAIIEYLLDSAPIDNKTMTSIFANSGIFVFLYLLEHYKNQIDDSVKGHTVIKIIDEVFLNNWMGDLHSARCVIGNLLLYCDDAQKKQAFIKILSSSSYPDYLKSLVDSYLDSDIKGKALLMSVKHISNTHICLRILKYYGHDISDEDKGEALYTRIWHNQHNSYPGRTGDSPGVTPDVIEKELSTSSGVVSYALRKLVMSGNLAPLNRVVCYGIVSPDIIEKVFQDAIWCGNLKVANYLGLLIKQGQASSCQPRCLTPEIEKSYINILSYKFCEEVRNLVEPFVNSKIKGHALLQAVKRADYCNSKRLLVNYGNDIPRPALGFILFSMMMTGNISKRQLELEEQLAMFGENVVFCALLFDAKNGSLSSIKRLISIHKSKIPNNIIKKAHAIASKNHNAAVADYLSRLLPTLNEADSVYQTSSTPVFGPSISVPARIFAPIFTTSPSLIEQSDTSTSGFLPQRDLNRVMSLKECVQAMEKGSTSAALEYEVEVTGAQVRKRKCDAMEAEIEVENEKDERRSKRQRKT